MKAPLSVLSAALVCAVAFVACGQKKPAVEPEATESSEDADSGSAAPVEAGPPPSLYDHLGGKDGVGGILDSFLANLTTDKIVSKYFVKLKGPKLDHFKQMLADEICQEAGGPCHYTGKSMKDAHKGMGITDAQFKAFVGDLQLALEEKQIGKDDVQTLLTKLGATQDDIVQKKDHKK